MKFLFLFLGLALGCTVFLFVLGDFTPYVGEPDRDIWVTQPSPGWKLLGATSVAVLFAAVSGLVFATTSKLLPAFRLVRLFLITAFGLGVIVYLFGPFKTLLGDGLVHYELPWGAVRVAISAVCGAGLAAVATAGAAICRTALSA